MTELVSTTLLQAFTIVGAWIERSRQLEAEVEWAKEVSDRLERLNQHLTAENTRLKNQFKSQEEDR